MTYTITLKRSAEKQLAVLPAADRVRVAEAIDGLATNPRPARAKALQGDLKGKLRIRIGDYRVIYEIFDKLVTVHVLEIGQRGGVY